LSVGFRIPFVAFFGRTLEEYLAMFAIAPGDLARGRILDCPSGPDSFVAEARAAGYDAIGCDPMYALAPDELATRGRANVEACLDAIDAQRGTLTFADFERFRASKRDAIERFLADHRAHHADGRYVAASLPTLPFADRSFDLVLAANFLFSYANARHGGLYEGDEFDLDFHLRSVSELARTAAREIRIAPMGSFDPPPRPHAFRDPVRAHLESLGFSTELVPSAYDAGLAGFNDVLVARRRAPECTPSA
jgi:hypothetical protein